MKLLKKMTFWAFVALYAGLFNSCVVVSVSNAKDPVEMEHDFICNGNLYGAGDEKLEEQCRIIKSQSELELLMDQMTSINPMKCSDLLMTIDFSLNDLVIIIDRVRGSGGYTIKITKVIEQEGLVTVYYSNIKPEGMSPSVMSQPFLFEKLSKTANEVHFVVNEQD
jgi:hypothetical protein